MDLSVVICTYNRSETARRAAASIVDVLTALPVTSEVIVVDDASDEPFTAEGVVVFRHHRNLGASGARNSGARVARGDWLLFLDDDMVVDATAVSELWHRRHPNHCIVPLIRDEHGHLQNAVLSTWTGLDLKTTFSDAPLVEVAYPVGACFFVHRDLFERAGGFDERIHPNYCEDDAWGADLHAAGASVLMAEASTVGHHTHGGDLSDDYRRVIQARLAHNRWVFLLSRLRGWRRVAIGVLGAPRTLHESLNTRSLLPVRGYGQALLRLPELLSDKPTIGPLEERGRAVA